MIRQRRLLWPNLRRDRGWRCRRTPTRRATRRRAGPRTPARELAFPSPDESYPDPFASPRPGSRAQDASRRQIDRVMAEQRDLVEIVAELEQVVCVKGYTAGGAMRRARVGSYGWTRAMRIPPDRIDIQVTTTSGPRRTIAVETSAGWVQVAI